MGVTIACVLKSGGLYNASWVSKLKNGVERNLTKLHRFVCLSDVDVPCERIPLRHDWPGWWSKVELFSPWMEQEGRILYLDLDTLITGNIDDFAGYEGSSVCITKDFYCGVPSQSVLNFSPGSLRHLWDAFTSDPQKWMDDGDRKVAPHFGDQVLMTKCHMPRPIDYWQDVIPGQLVSFKVHCRDGLPENARVVCFHGKPKQCDFTGDHWIRKNWQPLDS